MDTLPPPLNWEDAKTRVCDFLDHIMRETGTAGFVLGLSGGVDSAAVAYLAAQRHRDRTLGILMPDASVTPRSETDDGCTVADATGISHATIPIDGIMDAYAKLGGDRRVFGNLRARVRSSILYHHANRDNRLVLGSTDLSEYMLGYYTKFGDGAADAVPIAHLYKTQVRLLAKHLGVPSRIYDKKSSPHLWPGHDAEEELGAPYHTIDRILYGTHHMRLDAHPCASAAGTPVETVRRILDISNRNSHKRGGPLRLQ